LHVYTVAYIGDGHGTRRALLEQNSDLLDVHICTVQYNARPAVMATATIQRRGTNRTRCLLTTTLARWLSLACSGGDGSAPVDAQTPPTTHYHSAPGSHDCPFAVLSPCKIGRRGKQSADTGGNWEVRRCCRGTNAPSAQGSNSL